MATSPTSSKKPGHFFPSGLKSVQPHPITYDIFFLLMILTTFILPLYLALPYLIESASGFFMELGGSLIWLVGVVGLGIGGIGMVLVGEKLWSRFSKKVVVEVVTPIKEVKEEVKESSSSIGENQKVKKVWRDKISEESTNKSNTPTRSSSRFEKVAAEEREEEEDGIELQEIIGSPSSRLRKRAVPPLSSSFPNSPSRSR